jgi:sugar phosphate isomerase/epimerase
MADSGGIRFGVDLITLYDPSFWGIEDFNSFYDNSVLPPEAFWDRALDTLAGTGVEGVEITFGPGHWQNALTRYGSGTAFREAVEGRGLTVCSGFYTGLVLGGDWQPEERQRAVFEEVAAYAEFLAESGCDIMITGLPMRRSWDADEPLFVDVDYAARLADVLNRMGYETLKRGVRLAIHPETHAVFWLQRDLDLFLALTDPVYVGFCPDTAHITLGGTDVVDVFRKHYQRVIISHWKDAKGRVPVHYRIDENIFKSHHRFFSRVGTGDVDWKSWAEGFANVGWQGWAILELDAAADPPAQIAAAKQFVDANLVPILT